MISYEGDQSILQKFCLSFAVELRWWMNGTAVRAEYICVVRDWTYLCFCLLEGWHVERVGVKGMGADNRFFPSLVKHRRGFIPPLEEEGAGTMFCTACMG